MDSAVNSSSGNDWMLKELSGATNDPNVDYLP